MKVPLFVIRSGRVHFVKVEIRVPCATERRLLLFFICDIKRAFHVYKYTQRTPIIDKVCYVQSMSKVCCIGEIGEKDLFYYNGKEKSRGRNNYEWKTTLSQIP